MMKKIYLSLVALSLSMAALAQCTPDPSVTKPGISPAKLPDGIVGEPYSQVVTLLVPLDSTILYQGTPYNIRIDSAPGTEEKRDVPDYLEIQLPVVLVFM